MQKWLGIGVLALAAIIIAGLFPVVAMLILALGLVFMFLIFGKNND
jgi:hypothetical protein